MKTAIRTLTSPAELDRRLPTYFYGSARMGRALFAAMGDPQTWSFCGFIDSKEAGNALGFPIFDLADFARRYRPGDQVVITSGFVEEIRRCLGDVRVAAAYDANPWHAQAADRARIPLLTGGTPLRDGVPYDGPERPALMRAQQLCDALEFDAAATELELALGERPTSTALLSMFAYVRWAQNRGGEALALCERVLAHDPVNRTALNRIGRIRFAQGRYDEVARISRRLLEIDPDDIWALSNFALAGMRAQPLETAIAELTAVSSQVSPRCRGTVAYLTRLAAYVDAARRAADDLEPRLRLAGNGRRKFVLAMTVYGDEYIEDLLRFALPSLIAPGNLDVWAGATDSLLLIVTNSAETERIANAPAYRAAAKLLPCQIVAFPDDLVLDESALKYQLFTATLLTALRIAKANAAGLAFLAPDYVFSTGFMRKLWQTVEAGNDAVFYCMHGIEKRAFHDLEGIEGYRDGAAFTLDAATLRTIGLPLLPPYLVRNEFHDGGLMNEYPGELIWRLADGGILTRAYFNHPLLFTETALAAYDNAFFHSNDSDFLTFVSAWDPAFARCAVIPDGDDGLVLELVSRSMVPVRERTSPPVSDLDKIAAFGIGLTATHRWQITQRSVYSGLPSGAVAAAAAESDAAVADVCARMQRYHERYGERNHANGYAPHVHLGFPESPVEV